MSGTTERESGEAWSAGDATARLETARRLVDREREILRTERDAFAAFRRRVGELEAGTHAGGTATPGLQRTVLTAGASSDRRFRRAVGAAYEETVMATDHYEAEYGDTYAESVAAELGEDVAASLLGDGAATRMVERRVRQGAAAAVDDRERLLDALDAEATALDEAAGTVGRLADELFAVASRPLWRCGVAELERLSDDLAALRERCDELGDERQRELRRRHRTLVRFTGVPYLPEYLYQSAAFTYPVLATVADLVDRIESTDDHVVAALPDG